MKYDVVYVVQVQAGEIDVSAGPNVKAMINSTEHAHNAAPNERVHIHTCIAQLLICLPSVNPCLPCFDSSAFI